MPASLTGAEATVVLNGVSYHLDRRARRDGSPGPAVVAGQFGPGDATQQQVSRDVPRIWDDFSGGGGYSRRDATVPNGYAWCVGDPRSPRLFAPGGAVTEIPMLPGIALPAPTFDSFEHANYVYILIGHQVLSFYLPDIGFPFVVANAAAGTFFTSAAIYDNAAYVGCSGGFLHKFDFTTLTWTASTTARRDWLAVVYWVVAGVGAYRLVGSVPGTHELKVFPSDPTAPGDPMNDDDWSAAYPVGEPSSDIRGLVASADHVYVIKPEGVHDLDGRGYAPNLTPYWRQMASAALAQMVGKGLVHGQYVYANHLRGLDRVRLGSGPERDRPEWCHPGLGTPNETPIFGTVQSMCPDGEALLVSISNGVDSYICWGRSRDQAGVQSGPGAVLWHMALAKLPGVFITHMKVYEMQGLPYLLMGGLLSSDAATPKLYRMALLRAANPGQGILYPTYGYPAFSYATEASITLPVDDWGDATAVKTLRRFDVQADNLGPATVELFAAAEGSAFASQGLMTTSPRETLIPGDTQTTGYQIGTRVDLAGTAAAPALLRALKARAGVSVDASEQRVYRLRLGQMTEGYTRARDRRDPEVLFAQLWPLQSGGAVPFRDHRGRDLTVKVENVSQEETEVPGSGGRRWELVAVVTLSVLSRPAYWDVSIFDSDATWVAS